MPQENEPKIPNFDPIPQGASDMELAMFLSNRIDNPCTVEAAPGQIENIRAFYLQEAEMALAKMTEDLDAA